MSDMTIPKDGVNPYADHPGFTASGCPLRYTVTQRGPWGHIGSCGFGCEMTGGHCLPGEQCEGFRAKAAEHDRMKAIFQLARESA